MKKLFLPIISLLAILFVSCSKDDDNVSLSVMINVLYEDDLAYPSLVRLYDYEEAKDFDSSKEAAIKYGDKQILTNRTGAELTPMYESGTFSGVNTFENIKAGTYLAVILYKPDGYSFPMFYYYGTKVIQVDKDNNAILHKIEFTYEHERGEFLKF